ncbi:hypothetical protein [Caballeronia grimmiae]|uniref:hypothetical protein n=1 Tax=Caballeronia grimmiae TaxID=1071679 RepID=UPI0038BBADE8
MSTLYFNPLTKVIFASDDAQDVSHEITADEVDTLKAGGAAIDPSASDLLGNVASTAVSDAAVAQGDGSDTTSVAPAETVSTQDAAEGNLTATDAAPVAQDPAASVITSDTAGDAAPLVDGGAVAEGDSGNVDSSSASPPVSSGDSPANVADLGNEDAAVTGSPSVTAATDASSASSVDTQPAIDSNTTDASTASTVDVANDPTTPATTIPTTDTPVASVSGVPGDGTAASDDAGNAADTPATSDSQSADASPEVISNAQADPGGAGSADLDPKPAAPNVDAQASAVGTSSARVPLYPGEPSFSTVASQNDADVEEDHPLSIIAEIEALLVLIAAPAVHEYHRILQRLADLKNHPQVKEGAE